MKNQSIAVLLAFFLGIIGAHRFYLGRVKSGLVYLLFCWTGFTFFLGVLEAIRFALMDPIEFKSRYRQDDTDWR